MSMDSYFAFLQGYVQELEQMAGQEREKYAALVSYDHQRIDRAVSAQQAANMRLAQLENQRQQEQRLAGLEGLTFQQILDRLEGAQRDRFSQLFTRFGRAVEEIRYYNGWALSFANEGLRILGGVAPGAQPGTYDAAGKRPGQGGASPLFDAEV